MAQRMVGDTVKEMITNKDRMAGANKQSELMNDKMLIQLDNKRAAEFQEHQKATKEA